MQVINGTHPIFQKLYHTNICTSSLYEFAIFHSQTSWIIEVVSYKSFNVIAALHYILKSEWQIRDTLQGVSSLEV